MGCGLSSFLLDFVHLLQVFLRGRVQFGAESFLSLEWASLRLRYLIHFESAPHRGVHHDLARSLDLLQGVQSDIVEVTRAIQVPLFVAHHLLEEVVSSSLPLLSLQEQVVSRRDLVMLVVLNVSDGLIQVTVWADARGRKAILDLAQELFDHWDSVFANHNALHLYGLHLSVPLMGPNVGNHETLRRVSVQNLSDQVFCCL